MAIGGAVGGTVTGYRAYESGANGWNIAAAAAGGAGAGILAAWTGGLTAAAVGTVVGASAAGAAAAGAVGGMVGGATSGIINGGIGWLTHKNTLGQAAKITAGAAGLGAITGAGAVAFGPMVRGGSNFNPFTSPTTWGPRAQQLYQQTVIGSWLDTAACLLRLRKCE